MFFSAGGRGAAIARTEAAGTTKAPSAKGPAITLDVRVSEPPPSVAVYRHSTFLPTSAAVST